MVLGSKVVWIWVKLGISGLVTGVWQIAYILLIGLCLALPEMTLPLLEKNLVYEELYLLLVTKVAAEMTTWK